MTKSILSILFFCLSFLGTSESKQELICHTWKLTTVLPFKKELKTINSANSETLTFSNNGTYEKLLYGQLTIKGEWGMTSDSSKLAFNITSMNGARMASSPLNYRYATDSIIQLSKDTLIIARVAYYGPKKVYGHDDYCYARQADHP